MKFLQRLAHWWLNWMSGDALRELERLQFDNRVLREEIRLDGIFLNNLVEMNRRLLSEKRDNLQLIANLRRSIRRFEGRAGCSLKYLEELEDLRYRLRQYESLEKRLHAQIKIPNPPTGADMGLT